MGKCVWLKPELVAQVEFVEWTPDGPDCSINLFPAHRTDGEEIKITRFTNSQPPGHSAASGRFRLLIFHEYC